jgi:hypothetical protein
MRENQDETVCLYCRKPLNGRGIEGYCRGKEKAIHDRLDVFTGKCFTNSKPNGVRF